MHRQRRGIGWLVGGLALLGLLSFLLFRSRGPEHGPANLNLRTPDLPTMPKLPEKFPDLRLPEVNPRAEPPKGAQPPPGAPGVATPLGAPQPGTPATPPQELSPTTGTSALAIFLDGSEATPRRFILRGLEFDSSSSAITNTGPLDDAAKVLRDHPAAKIRLEGHTDATGSEPSNRTLSTARAEAVKSYLVSKGVDQSRIEAVGRAYEAPIVLTSEPNPINRRVELVVVSR
jgi:outer membrane protein OmpA-like peptidoglycan-associated protein